MEPTKRLSDPTLKSYLRTPPRTLTTLPDGAIPELGVRLGTGGAANWTLLLRVAGEGGANASGKLMLGPSVLNESALVPLPLARRVRAASSPSAPRPSNAGGLRPKTFGSSAEWIAGALGCSLDPSARQVA